MNQNTPKAWASKNYDALADILNALPNVDPHDDEAWMTDKCYPKFAKYVQEVETEAERRTEEKIAEQIMSEVRIGNLDLSDPRSWEKGYNDCLRKVLASLHSPEEPKP